MLRMVMCRCRPRPQAAAVLLGPRQVGKTTLALDLGVEWDAVSLDLERPNALARLGDVERFCELTSEKLLSLDEVHRTPDLFAVLRGIQGQARSRGSREEHPYRPWPHGDER